MRCPVCTAESDTGPSCRRCRADLSLLFRLEEERACLGATARRALLEGGCNPNRPVALAGACHGGGYGPAWDMAARCVLWASWYSAISTGPTGRIAAAIRRDHGSWAAFQHFISCPSGPTFRR